MHKPANRMMDILQRFYLELAVAPTLFVSVGRQCRMHWYMHTVKKGSRVSRPQPGCHYQTLLGGNNDVITELLLPRGSLVSGIPAEDEKLVNLFLRCMGCTTWKDMPHFFSWWTVPLMVSRHKPPAPQSRKNRQRRSVLHFLFRFTLGNIMKHMGEYF